MAMHCTDNALFCDGQLLGRGRWKAKKLRTSCWILGVQGQW